LGGGHCRSHEPYIASVAKVAVQLRGMNDYELANENAVGGCLLQKMNQPRRLEEEHHVAFSIQDARDLT